MIERRFLRFLRLALAAAVVVVPAMAQTGTFKFWSTTTADPSAGEPHQTTEDVAGLTNHVGAPAMVTAYEACCGILFWNPTTNAFASYCVGGGFGFVVDINRGTPSGVAKTFGGGDTWAAIFSGSPPVYMNFRGSNDFRTWPISGNNTGIRVNAATGKVYVGRFTVPGEIKELNPATNVVTTWVTGAKTYFLDTDGTFIWATAVNDAGSSQPDQIIRLNPATNEVKRWNLPTNGSFFTTVSGPNMPNGIALDADGNVWFAETAANKIARLNPVTNVISEFTKTGLIQPQSVSTSGSGSSLQVFFPEAFPPFGDATKDQVSLMTVSAATPTNTTVTPTTSTVTPTAATATPSDLTITPVTATVPPITCTSAGVDPSGITRFPTGGAGLTGTGCTGFAFPSGISRVAFPFSILGSMAESDKVFQLTSTAITAPPGAGGPAGCDLHRVHGHISSVPSGHFPATHVHHGQHGHTVTLCAPPHHGPFHMTPETEEQGLFSANGITEAFDFFAAGNQDGDTGPARRGTVLELFGSARGLFIGDEHDQPVEAFTPPASGSPLFHTTTLPQVRIGGVAAKVLFSGLAPGQTGTWQINVVVPEDIPAGTLPVAIDFEGDQLRSIDIVVR